MAEKTRLICGSCSWRFERHFAPNKCPYCGRATLEVDKSKGAQDLLEEISEIERDIQARKDGTRSSN